MKKIFGTDGVRGTANQDPMTSEMALKIGRAAAHAFRDSSRRHRIVIKKGHNRAFGHRNPTITRPGKTACLPILQDNHFAIGWVKFWIKFCVRLL